MGPQGALGPARRSMGACPGRQVRSPRGQARARRSTSAQHHISPGRREPLAQEHTAFWQDLKWNSSPPKRELMLLAPGGERRAPGPIRAPAARAH